MRTTPWPDAIRPVLLAQLFASSIAGSAAAQEVATPDSAKADTVAAPVEETVGLKLGALPLYLSGYVTSTFTYSFAATGNQLVGRFYDRYQKQFMANGLELGLTKPVDTGKLDAGARAELLFGQDAAVTQSQGLSLGPNGDLTEAYVILNVPTGGADHWIQFKLGKMWTIMGYEVIDDILDPNLDVGNQFVYLENFTNTGLGRRLQVRPEGGCAAAPHQRVGRGRGQQQRAVVHGPAGTHPVAVGDDRAPGLHRRRTAGQRQQHALRIRGAWHLQAGDEDDAGGQFDWGTEEGCCRTPTRMRAGGAAGCGSSRRCRRPSISPSGATTSTTGTVSGRRACWAMPRPDARKFGSATATLNIHVFPKATIRPEFRIDFSSLDDYGEVDDPTSTQPSIGVGATYAF